MRFKGMSAYAITVDIFGMMLFAFGLIMALFTTAMALMG